MASDSRKVSHATAQALNELEDMLVENEQQTLQVNQPKSRKVSVNTQRAFNAIDQYMVKKNVDVDQMMEKIEEWEENDTEGECSPEPPVVELKIKIDNASPERKKSMVPMHILQLQGDNLSKEKGFGKFDLNPVVGSQKQKTQLLSKKSTLSTSAVIVSECDRNKYQILSYILTLMFHEADYSPRIYELLCSTNEFSNIVKHFKDSEVSLLRKFLE